MSRREHAIIFDGDDTLWAIQGFYDDAKEAFYELMEQLGFSRPRVQERLAQIDRANMAEYGFSRFRFPQSMQDTLRYFFVATAQVPTSSLLEKAYAIGSAVFDRRPEIAPGAREMLAKLKPLYSLFLYSVGDTEVQWKKVHDLDIEPFFEKIYITERKTPTELQIILNKQDLDPSRTWMVGNSLRSDINPALRLGLRCIWVHANTWDYDQEDLLPGRVWQVKDLREIPILLASVETTA